MTAIGEHLTELIDWAIRRHCRQIALTKSPGDARAFYRIWELMRERPNFTSRR